MFGSGMSLSLVGSDRLIDLLFMFRLSGTSTGTVGKVPPRPERLDGRNIRTHFQIAKPMDLEFLPVLDVPLLRACSTNWSMSFCSDKPVETDRHGRPVVAERHRR
jgi:hypothetical protein